MSEESEVEAVAKALFFFYCDYLGVDGELSDQHEETRERYQDLATVAIQALDKARTEAAAASSMEPCPTCNGSGMVFDKCGSGTAHTVSQCYTCGGKKTIYPTRGEQEIFRE